MDQTGAENERIRRLAPVYGWKPVSFAEIWDHRELLWSLAMRDIKVRYKQTLIGVTWVIIQPLGMMLVFVTFFHLLKRVPADPEVAYPLTLIAALLPWQMFSKSVSRASNSLVTNEGLIKRIYFPRVIIPLAPVITHAFDFFAGFLIVIGLFFWYGEVPSWNLLALPFFVALIGLVAFSIGLWFSALTALYRDARYVVPFLVQIGFFLSPVVYETNALIPDQWRNLYSLNPMVGILEGFRWCLFGKQEFPTFALSISIAVLTIITLGGLLCFHRMENQFVDRI